MADDAFFIAQIACFCAVIAALLARRVERSVAFNVANLMPILFGAKNRTTFCHGTLQNYAAED